MTFLGDLGRQAPDDARVVAVVVVRRTEARPPQDSVLGLEDAHLVVRSRAAVELVTAKVLVDCDGVLDCKCNTGEFEAIFTQANHQCPMPKNKIFF